MLRLVPVKLRPDQYCSQIRDTNRKGKNVNITRLHERMEYVKVKKEKGEDKSNNGVQINCESMCGPGLSIENNNSSPSLSAALFATNDSDDLLKIDDCVSTDQKVEGSGSRVEAGVSIEKTLRNRPFTCPVCERGFTDLLSVQDHINTHFGSRPYKCKHCDESFACSSSQRRHVQYMHTHEKRFKCKDCDYMCVESSKLKRHIRIHSGERPYPCQHCSYASPDAFSLKRHLRTHTGEKPYVCTVCQAKFSQQNTLKTHRKVHSDRNPSYQCKSCPLALGSKHALYKHVQNLHTSEEPIPCKLCGKTFQDRYTLKVHKKTHIGEKCYECALCQYSCFTKASLSTHMLIHSDHKPFQCNECQQSFRYKQALQRHQNLQHNPFYVYVPPKKKVLHCPQCDRCFHHKKWLLKHVSLHESENSNKDIKIVSDGRDQANSSINSPQVDVPGTQTMDREVELHFVCDVIELPKDGAHGGVQIAAVAEDHQHGVQQDENCLQYYHDGYQQSDSHSNQGAHGLSQRWDISNYFGFSSDSE